MFVLFISNKKKVISFLLLIILCGVSAFLFKDSFIRRYFGVKRGVTFLEQNMQGFSREEVSSIVSARLGEWLVNPVDALYEHEKKSIVPELWGYEVNLQGTVEKIMAAAPGEEIFPVLDPLLPDISIKDYPWAFIERGNPKKKEITFMINVAWGTEFIPPLLDILAVEDASANFFVVGRWAQENEGLLKEIHKRGHLIENHGHTDALVYTQLSAEEIKKGLQEVNSLVQSAVGREPLFFTPHKGEYNELVLEVVSRQGMRTVLWSLDTVDWMTPGVEKMKTKVLENLHEGAIILMHPTEDTVTFLKEVIPEIKERGFKIVTLENLFNPHYPPTDIK